MLSASHARKIAPERGLDPNSFALREQAELASLMIAEAAREGRTDTEFFVQPLVTANNPFHVIAALVKRFQSLGYEVDYLSPVLLRFDWSKANVDEPMSDEAIARAVGPAIPSPATPAMPPFPAPQAAPAAPTVRQSLSVLPPMPLAAVAQPPFSYVPPPRAVVVNPPAPAPAPAPARAPPPAAPPAAPKHPSTTIARPGGGAAQQQQQSTPGGSAKKKRRPRVNFTI